jgi:tetratricopeptide (TPR) repeat protein
MLVRKAVTDRLRTVILIAGMSLPLFAQQPANRALAADLDRALASRQIEQVGQALEAILARPHVELEVLLETGAKLADHELFELARAAFTRAVSDYPRSFEVRYNLALADFALRRFSEAQSTLDGAPELSKEQQLSREYLRGKLYDALGQTDLAEKSFLAAFHGSPQQENYGLDLGLYYLRRHLYPKALETLKAALKYHSDSIYLELGLGLAQILGDDPPRAVATCRRILAKEPNFGAARLLLVLAFYMNGENQNCAAETAPALRQPGAPPYLYYLHAASLLRLNSREYAAMLHDLDEANRGIPGCAFCYFAQSKIHQQMGDESAAITDLEQLVTRVDPEFSQGWYRLASLYQHAGRRDDAAKALERFRSIKGEQTDREMEYLRKVFLSALGGEQAGR